LNIKKKQQTKANEELIQGKNEVDSNKGKYDRMRENKKANPFYDAELIGKVHLLYDGKCTSCSSRMDKSVARFKRIDQSLPPTFDNFLLLCPDCYKKRKNPALDGFSVGPKAMLKFESLRMDQTAINLFLSDFMNKFVLIEIVESMNLREYWVIERQPIVRFRVIDSVITDLQIAKNRIIQSS